MRPRPVSAKNRNQITQNKILHNANLHRFFKEVKSPIKKEHVITSPQALAQVARHTLQYINRHEKTLDYTIKPKLFDQQILPTRKAKETLAYIIKLIDEDTKTGNYRILDPEFLSQNFTFIKWSGDTKKAKRNRASFVAKDKIYLTLYGMYHVKGSYKKTKKYAYALYKLLGRHKAPSYTKQQVLSGILEKKDYHKKVKPLVWLSRKGLEQALMQGTIFVTMPDEKLRGFNIHYNNRIPYDKKIKNKYKQKRYWYFREFRQKTIAKTRNRFLAAKGIIFAGDIYNLGIGKLIAIPYTDPVNKKRLMRLGILADTGGAFTKNLYQLDLFAGIFSSKKKFQRYMRHFPNVTDAYILARK